MENFSNQYNTGSLKEVPGKKNTFREILFKYLAYLPMFLLSIAVAVGGSALYIRYAIPKYKSTANMLVKSAEDYSIASTTNNDLISSSLFGGRKMNIDNEIERLRSNSFLSRVVNSKNLNISYFNEGMIKKSDIYVGAPFEIVFSNLADSSKTFSLYILVTSKEGGILSQSKDGKKKSIPFIWDTTCNYFGNIFVIKKKTANSLIEPTGPTPYYIQWKPTNAVVSKLRSSVTVSSLSVKTTIVQLSIITENPFEGKDILNFIIDEYKQMNVEDKSRVAKNTIDFINDRLGVVTQELKNLTTDLQDFKNKNNVLDVQKQFTFYFDNSYANIKLVDNIDLSLKILGIIEEYLQKSNNQDKTIPTNLGINDLTLTNLIAAYNQAQLKREREAPFLLNNSPILKDYNNQIAELRNNILESIKQVRKQYDLQKSELAIKSKEYKENLYNLPEKDIQLQEIVRQQGIKQQLYLYLLQKREETEIASVSTVSDYQQIDFAEANLKQVEPDESKIRMICIILGLLIPVLIIYVIDMLNDKLTTRDDIVNRTHLPIVGEISHVDKTMSTIVVGQSRNMIAEQFRILRSNLHFIFKTETKAKTILVTSSISGEGKSFISLNLAAVLSLSGKKVALLEFDLRKMRSHLYQGERQNTKGITNYLIGQMDDTTDIITSIDKFPTLDIYRSGPIPPNPGELVMGDKVKQFIAIIKEQYDYVVIDSAPVGLVSDSFALVEYADASLFVLRQRYTFKKQIDFVEDINQKGKLKNVVLIVNDVHMGGKYGYYGYGYGYGYGYIYRYGFGYRYGYGYGAYAGKYFKKGAEGYFDMPGKK